MGGAGVEGNGRRMEYSGETTIRSGAEVKVETAPFFTSRTSPSRWATNSRFASAGEEVT